MMQPPDLWKIALDDRIRGMLQSESSSRGKKVNSKGTREATCLIVKGCTAFTQDHSGPASEEQVDSLMSKKRQVFQLDLGGNGTRPRLQARRRLNPKERAWAKGNRSTKG